MYHLSDKELDRLSREAADQFDVEQPTSGWEALESTLNKELPIEDSKRRRWFLFLLIFISVSSGGTLLYLLVDSPAERTIVKESEKQAEKETQNLSSDIFNTDDSQNPQPKSPQSSDNSLRNEPGRDLESSRDQAVPGSPGQETIAKVNNTDIDNTRLDRKGERLISPRKNQQRLPLRKTHPPAAINDRTNTEPKEPMQAESTDPGKSGFPKSDLDKLKTALPSMVALYDRNIIIDLETISPRQIAQIEGQNVQKKPVAIDSYRKHRFHIGAVGSPDRSSVKFSHRDKTGYNLGLTLSYRLSNRVSFQTGLIYTNKSYTARGSDYHPPKDYWTYDTELHTVEGACSMFDIPVNVRYDINQHPKHRIFVSTGFSSYLMNEETYNFHYTYNGVYGTRERGYESNEKHLFSIINVSAGIESRLNKSLSLQLEPYFKIPVQGLGFGNIRLNSFGAYLGINYRPFR